MKKTISINLQGLIFNIDEDAYALLSSYIEKLKLHFGSIDEGEEIMKDIEARIAELFTEKLSKNLQVINIENVEEIISILGNADEIIDEDLDYDSDSQQASQSTDKKRKKLYRDTDRRLLGGVCSGLSSYSGINLLAMRSIFAILLLVTMGTMLLVYLLLWIIIPKARTRVEKLEMKGEKVNISNIEKDISEEYQEIKANMQKLSKSIGLGEALERFGKSIASFINIIFKILGKVFGVGFIAIGIVGMISFLIGIFAFNSETLVYDWAGITIIPIAGIFKYIAEPPLVYGFLVAFAFAICIPMVALAYAGICIVLSKRSNRVLNLSLFLTWFVGSIICVGIGFVISSEYMSHEDNRTSFEISCDSVECDTIYLSAIDNNKFNDEIDGLVFDKVCLYREDGVVKANGEVDIEIKPSKDSLLHGEEIRSSRGSNRDIAKNNIKDIKYDFHIDSNSIAFDKYFSLPENFKIRAQNVRVILYIPVGRTVFIDETLEDLIDDTDNLNNLDEDEMSGVTWIMTSEGLVLP